jgi:hypothetical protein
MTSLARTSSLPPFSLGVLCALGTVFVIVLIVHFRRRASGRRDDQQRLGTDSSGETGRQIR